MFLEQLLVDKGRDFLPELVELRVVVEGVRVRVAREQHAFAVHPLLGKRVPLVVRLLRPIPLPLRDLFFREDALLQVRVFLLDLLLAPFELCGGDFNLASHGRDLLKLLGEMPRDLIVLLQFCDRDLGLLPVDLDLDLDGEDLLDGQLASIGLPVWLWLVLCLCLSCVSSVRLGLLFPFGLFLLVLGNILVAFFCVSVIGFLLLVFGLVLGSDHEFDLVLGVALSLQFFLLELAIPPDDAVPGVAPSDDLALFNLSCVVGINQFVVETVLMFRYLLTLHIRPPLCRSTPRRRRCRPGAVFRLSW